METIEAHTIDNIEVDVKESATYCYEALLNEVIGQSEPLPYTDNIAKTP